MTFERGHVHLVVQGGCREDLEVEECTALTHHSSTLYRLTCEGEDGAQSILSLTLDAEGALCVGGREDVLWFREEEGA